MSALLWRLAGSTFAATTIVPGIDLVPGEFIPNHQPDGNSIIFHAPDGLIVMDTGRHAAHTQQILDYAQQAKLPIKAVINSHWHLDHIGGNPRIRAAYPQVRIYASSALDGALKGFLADYRKYLVDAIAKAGDDTRQSLRDELAIIDAGPALAPDEVVTKTSTQVIAGRKLELHLEKDSVTAGDVWVFDPTTRVLAAGDLVTLPVPFLDTACPAHWKSALDNLARSNFKILVPGHGDPMQRKEFETYRGAYANLLACSTSTKSKNECVDGWVRDAGALIADKDRAFAKSLMDYYVDDSLRAEPAKLASSAARDSKARPSTAWIQQLRIQQFIYFQLRGLPSASHSIACASRLRARFVALGLDDPLDVFALLARTEARERRRALSVAFQRRRKIIRHRRRRLGLWLRAHRFYAVFVELHRLLDVARQALRDGRSASFVMRPNWPIARSSSPAAVPTTSLPFQKPSTQCCLNAAIAHNMP